MSDCEDLDGGQQQSAHEEERDRGHRSGYDRNQDDRRSDRRERGGGNDRNYAFTEEMDIPSDCVGKIIGRGGSNIQRVQSDFNVRVDLDKGRNVAKISGHSDENVKDAQRYIQEQIDTGNSDRGGGGGRQGGGGYGGGGRYERGGGGGYGGGGGGYSGGGGGYGGSGGGGYGGGGRSSYGGGGGGYGGGGGRDGRDRGDSSRSNSEWRSRDTGGS